VGACGVGISETTREALGLQDGALVMLCRRSAVDPPCSSASAPSLPYASRLILSPPAGHEWQHGAGDLGRTSRAATAVLLSQLVGARRVWRNVRTGDAARPPSRPRREASRPSGRRRKGGIQGSTWAGWRS
jgi:hypothetical protein